MYNKLLAHRDYVAQKLSQELSSDEREELYNYHIKRVQDFQHERLIHLLVTFFFAALLIGAIFAWLCVSALGAAWLFYSLITILFILEAAYVRHYYQLENGVQSLYELSEKLGKLR